MDNFTKVKRLSNPNLNKIDTLSVTPNPQHSLSTPNSPFLSSANKKKAKFNYSHEAVASTNEDGTQIKTQELLEEYKFDADEEIKEDDDDGDINLPLSKLNKQSNTQKMPHQKET